MLLGVKNVNRDGSIASSSQSARLFRAGTGVHYEGIVHNKAVYTGKVMPLNATILHYGYDLPPDAMARKYQRTASLLHRRLEDNPDDIEAHFYLCQVYMHMGDAEKAMPYGRRCLEMVAHLDEGMDKSFYWTLYHSLAVCCLVAGRHDEARLWVARGLERLPHDVDLHYDLVQLALIAKDFPGLAAAAEKHIALACRYRQAPQAYGTRFIYTAGPDYEQQVRYWLLTARVALREPERAREQWPMVLPYLLKKPEKVMEYLGNLVHIDGGDLTAEHAAALARGFMEAGDVVRAAECCRFGLDAGVRQPEFLVTVLFLGRMMGNDALEADAATAYLEGLSSYDEMPSPVAAMIIDFLLSQGHERHAVDIMGVLFSRYGLSLPAADEPGVMKAIAAGCERLAAEFAADSPLAAATCKQLATRIAGGLGYAPTGAEKIAENITSQVDKLNTLDMVCHHEKNDDKAPESLQQALLIEPSHDEFNPPKKIKVIHLPLIIANTAIALSKYLNRLGVDSKVISYFRTWLNYQGDINLDLDGLTSVERNKKVKEFVDYFFENEAHKYDIFHFHFFDSLSMGTSFGGWKSHPEREDYWDLQKLKEMGKKIVVSSWGSDVRNNSKMIYYQLQYEQIEGDIPYPPLNRTYQYLKIWKFAQYADAIVHGDTEVCKHTPYSIMIPILIDLEPFDHLIKGNKINNKRLSILHAPSNQFYKGTNYTESILERITERYREKIEIRKVHGLSYQEAIKEYLDNGAAIAGIATFSFGLFALEAMYVGRTVFTTLCAEEFFGDDPKLKAPIVSVNNQNDFYNKLTDFIDKGYVDHSDEYKEFIVNNFSASVIAPKYKDLYERLLSGEKI
jgi:tetratricopeptide (TPR) repeat protein